MEVPDYTREVVEGVQRDRDAIDAEVDAAAAGWTADRLGAVERSILRLATWELRQGELPPAVVIDEAMELAKRYAGAEAAPFVNGVLGAIARGGEDARVSTNPALADLLARLDAARARLGDAAGRSRRRSGCADRDQRARAGRQRGARAAAPRNPGRARR